jgi:hypothetical protein
MSEMRGGAVALERTKREREGEKNQGTKEKEEHG